MEAFLEENRHLKIQLEEIKSATNNFDNNNIIGKGGFGVVYKGVLSHSKGQSMVAFKRLDRMLGQGNPEFLKEILTLSHYTHENLISLLGFCDEDGEKILVYEYACHGSLDRHLSANSLTWLKRLKICLAAAKGLCYLHDPKGTEQRAIHRDIKSSNILLDASWTAKLSDMGLSKIAPANQHHSFVATNVAGTFVYTDPVYMETYFITKESDVYSFGMVLFEVLCGRLCFEYNHGQIRSLWPMWKKSYEEKKLDQIIFEDMKEQMNPSSLEKFTDIAYRCLQKSREQRPTMSSVVEELKIALYIQKTEGLLDFEEIIKTAVAPHVYQSEEELQMLLYRGVLVNGDKTWFSINKNGEHCEMISSALCLIPILSASPTYEYNGQEKSRFSVDKNTTTLYWRFKMHVNAQFLSPNITYAINLVFGIDYEKMDLLFLDYKLADEKCYSTSYIAEKREDGWFMTELYQFTSIKSTADFDITFDCRGHPLRLEGIEFQPVERWFSLEKNGKKCHMVPARMALRISEWIWVPLPESRFDEVALCNQQSFSLTCTSTMLSPQIRYACYLVYTIQTKNPHVGQVVEVRDHSWITPCGYKLRHILLYMPDTPTIRQKVKDNTRKPLRKTKMEGIPQHRNDGWLEVQVCKCETGDTTSEKTVFDLSLYLKSFSRIIRLTMQGIELRAI